MPKKVSGLNQQDQGDRLMICPVHHTFVKKKNYYAIKKSIIKRLHMIADEKEEKQGETRCDP